MESNKINKTGEGHIKTTEAISITDAISQSSENEINSPITSNNNLKTQKCVTFSNISSTIVYKRPIFKESVDSKTLIEEYIKSCDSFNIKPIDQIIIQLEEFEVIKSRLPNLDLKGNKLDLKAVESLESIFMKIKVSNLDVENTTMDEEACLSLCEILQFYDSPLILRIGNNTRIDIRGWRAISHLIARSDSLEQIFLNRMVFTDSSINILSASLNQSISLRVLNLSNCYLNGPRLNHLSDGFKENCLIEELYLGGNKISSSDCEFIAFIIRRNHRLRVLDLENNPIQDLGLKYICSAMVQSEFSNIERLQLWNTSITSVGMQYLSSLLYRTKFNNHFDTLKSLNIGKNKICDEGLLAIKTALIHNQCLERIGLASSKLSPTGIITLAEILADNRSLIRVDLRDNVINEAGVLALSQALRHNTTMLKINFNANFKVDSTMEIELNKVLDEIQTKCNLNREQARLSGKIDDALSIFSSISIDSTNSIITNTPNNSSISNFIMNILASPWRLTKTKLFQSYNKVDVEMKASKSPLIEPANSNNTSSQYLSSPELVSVQSKVNTPSFSSPPSSRFQVRPVTSKTLHRRCVSDDPYSRPTLLPTPQIMTPPQDTIIKLNVIRKPYCNLNTIPMDTDLSSQIYEESSTVVNKNKQRSLSHDDFNIATTSSVTIPNHIRRSHKSLHGSE